MPPTVPVPATTLLLDGMPIDDAVMKQLFDVQVRHSVLLPDTAVMRFRDPLGELVNDARFTPGKTLEVKFGAREEQVSISVFKGEIVALEPEFLEGDCRLSVRAYNRAWRLNRQRTSRTFVQMTAADMVSQVAQEAGLVPGKLAGANVRYEFFQQSMETDWEFCWRLARMNNVEFVVSDTKFDFAPRTAGPPAARLTWGENLLTFKPRLTGVGQVSDVTVGSHDPVAGRLVNGQANAAKVPHTSDAVSARGRMVADFRGGTVVVADMVAPNATEANFLAQSVLDRLASSVVEAEGKAYGDPKVRAGTTVKIENVGRFTGSYVLSETTHRFSGGTGYALSFVISGRTSHGLGDLLQRNSGPDWASGLVMGIVTNNVDPSDLGRIKVKFPQLGPNIESDWARVLSPHAGAKGGLTFIPDISDEVVVAFENGDSRRPLVLGSLFNGSAKPAPELHDSTGRPKKPLFAVKTTHEALVDSTQKMTLRAGEKMIVEVTGAGQGGTGDFTLDAKGIVEQKAAKSFKETAGAAFDIEGKQVTVKGTAVTVEASGTLTLKGAVVDVQASGPVNVKGSIINLG